MSDYDFLKLFNENMSAAMSAYDLKNNSNLEESIIDIKLDSLIRLNYIHVIKFEEVYKGEVITFSSRWLTDEALVEKVSIKNNPFLECYSLTNSGLEYVLEIKRKRKLESKIQFREWTFLIIAILEFAFIIFNIF